MKIDAIDIYWLKLPLAFVWRTSYADQHVTDTILVRMESDGHYAWGESCPPYIPGYSAEHTLATYHTLREHMAPRIIGQSLETSRDLLDLANSGTVARNVSFLGVGILLMIIGYVAPVPPGDAEKQQG